MIVIFEPQCRGFEHEQFNAAFLWGYSLAYPQSEIVFFAEQEHISSVKAILLSSNLSLAHFQFKDVTIPDSRSIAKPIVIFQYVTLLKIILDFAVSHNCDKVAFLSIYTYNLIPLKFLLKFKYKNLFKVHIAMHGTLEFIKRTNFSFFCSTYLRLLNYLKRVLNIKAKLPKNRSTNRFLYEKLFKFSLKFISNKNIIYFVFRDDCLVRLKNYLPEDFQYFRAIDLPYIFQEDDLNKELTSRNHLTFATFGKFNHNELKKIAKHFSSVNTNKGNRKLLIIGGDVNDDLDRYELVEYPISNHSFSRKEFEEILFRVDYFLFLYEKDSYELTTSGAFFDAIAHCKPMVFLNNYCFEHYFEQYNFGYKCQDFDEMLVAIDKLFDNHEKNYSGIVSEIKRMQYDKSIAQNYFKLHFST